MLTKKVKKRILFVTLVFSFFSIFIFIALKTLNNNLLYFNTPTDVFKNNNLSLDKKMRLGGMVKKKLYYSK